MNATLERKKIESDLFALPPDNFATACKEKLGYSVLVNVEKGEHNKFRMTEILNELDIKPFTNESVAKYKAQQISNKEPKWLQRLVALELIAFIALGIYIGWPHGLWMILAAFIGFMITMAITDAIWEWSGWGWISLAVKDETSRIPEFALQTAMDVRDRLAAESIPALIGVETLIRQQVRADPFLFVEVDGQRWYLEVWNEPSFKAKREL